MGAWESKARPIRVEPASGIFRRSGRDEPAGRPAQITSARVAIDDERARVVTGLVSMIAFAGVGCVHLAIGLPQALFLGVSMIAFAGFAVALAVPDELWSIARVRKLLRR